MHPLLTRRAVTLGLLGLLVVAGWPPVTHLRPAAASEHSTEVSFHSHAIEHDGVELHIDYCSNGPLVANAAIRRLVVMVHGDGRNACGYAAAGAEAAWLAGALDDTLVIAPHLITAEEPAAADEPDRLLVYRWVEGGRKLPGRALRPAVADVVVRSGR